MVSINTIKSKVRKYITNFESHKTKEHQNKRIEELTQFWCRPDNAQLVSRLDPNYFGFLKPILDSDSDEELKKIHRDRFRCKTVHWELSPTL